VTRDFRDGRSMKPGKPDETEKKVLFKCKEI